MIRVMSEQLSRALFQPELAPAWNPLRGQNNVEGAAPHGV
jgi:hypothetical protein